MAAIYTARLDTHPGRPGFLIEFRHPGVLDNLGKPGRKTRRGLATNDPQEANKILSDVSALLADPELHSPIARKLSKSKYHAKAVEIFYDAFIRNSDSGKKRREKALPLPAPNGLYNEIALVGSTSAGKTTLLRHLSGSDNTSDRFPATSGSRTTTFPLEMIVQESPFRAVLSFLSESEVYATVEQSVVRAVKKVLEGAENTSILEELLMPVEDGLRLKYLLGSEKDALSQSVLQFVGEVRAIASSTQQQIEKELGDGPIEAMRKEDQAAALDLIEAAAEESRQTDHLVNMIVEELRERSQITCLGEISRTATGWPRTWTLELLPNERSKFINELKRFTGNTREHFGRLMTPLVSGIRVSGPFFPKLFDSRQPLIFCDTVGFGHYASSGGDTPENTLEQLEHSDKILLVESAKGGFANADLHRLLESISTSGQTSKLLIVMTHLDLLAGDDVDGLEEQREKALTGLRVALGDSIKKRIGAEGVRQLSAHLSDNLFYLSNLNSDKPDDASISELQHLYSRLAEPRPGTIMVDAIPEYEWPLLTLAIHDGIEMFREQWQSLLGVRTKTDIEPLPWQTQKAIARRYANEINDLFPHRPATSFSRILATEIARFLDNPSSWSGTPTQSQKDAFINKIKQAVAQPLRKLSFHTLRTLPKNDWIEAWIFSGRYSTTARRDKMESILAQQVPFLRSNAGTAQLELFRKITEEVLSAFENIKSQVNDSK